MIIRGIKVGNRSALTAKQDGTVVWNPPIDIPAHSYPWSVGSRTMIDAATASTNLRSSTVIAPTTLLGVVTLTRQRGTVLEGPIYNVDNSLWWYRVRWDDPALPNIATNQGCWVWADQLATIVENRAPVASTQVRTATVGTPISITLAGTDADGDTITYTVTSQPTKGTLTGTAPNLTYTPLPEPDGLGVDGFSFRVNDGVLDSEPAAVEITNSAAVDPGNDTPVLLSRTGWTATASSFEANLPASNAIDGSTSTYWRSDNSPVAPLPHDLTVNLGVTRDVLGIRYLPRQTESTSGDVSGYEVYLSTDGLSWGSPVASGTFTLDKTEKQVTFTKTAARYVRFRITAGVGDAGSVGELGILVPEGTIVEPPPPPVDPPPDTPPPSDFVYLSSITQYGITWTFDRTYKCGQFVSGDWWVVGPVLISSISPTPPAGRNGSMINPIPAPDWLPSSDKQAYDNRIVRYDAALLATFPRTLTAGESLVSTISLTDSDLTADGRNYMVEWQSYNRPLKDHVKLKHAAVLTVLGEPPPVGSFRPPFCGTAKPLYNASSINRSLLRFLAPPTQSRPNLSYLLRGLERPWLQHGNWTQALFHHPTENMPYYHQYMGELLSEASLTMLTTLSTDDLEYRYIQRAIDVYYTVSIGAADQAYFEWPVMFAGLLLNDPVMMGASKDGTFTSGRARQKICHAGSLTSTVRSNIVPAGQTWTGSNVFFRKQGGNYEHEHLHPSEWARATANPATDPATSAGVRSEKYRQENDSRPHMGMALTSRILGQRDLWRDGSMHDYLDRWMTEDWTNSFAPVVNQYWSGVPDNTKQMGTTFMQDMWNAYNNYSL